MSVNKNGFYAVDLFAGPGGLGEGFTQAGFNVLVSADRDTYACRTLRTRVIYHYLKSIGKTGLYWDYVKGCIRLEDIYAENPVLKHEVEIIVMEANILPTTQGKIANEIVKKVMKVGATGITVLLGGPPCQLYSLIGRSRYSSMKDKFYRDPRRRLFEQYLFLLKELKPKVFVFENVPGILSAQFRRKEVIEILNEEFSARGYTLANPSMDALFANPQDYVLNCSDFGVPQLRKRVIIIGYQTGLRNEFHEIEQVYFDIYKQKNKLTELTVGNAIMDLPPLLPGEGGDRWLQPYGNCDHISQYALQMRADCDGVVNHRARTHMASDLERYNYFIENYANGNRAANLKDLMVDHPDLLPKHKNLSTFLDRFKVQRWDRAASTITSHISKDGHYYIHPDINQCRSFTVREAARCQSFPDNYFFEGPRTEQFRQVGNAVPPLLARAIALAIIKCLKKTNVD
jgi:DNA (cytosine-5)-methyltransferase 1